ncbi:sulfotransferase [Nocardioides sp.]|uniref:sulfotransferase n=1 Tax=Nocardioides sp. TaxID=35761 RepID=UPI0025E00386|nr:sulfotransferase [Nocardioides sp.]
MRHIVESMAREESTSTRPLIVLGMHRSGTSLMARLLSDLGWYLGRPEELLGPREDNPDGFFERTDVQVLNDRILSQVGASWDGPPDVCELLDLEAEVGEQVAALLATLSKDAAAAPFAVKDPRLCVLWPVWERHLPPDAKLVLIFRHPAEVAASLHKRDSLPLVTGLALWEEYVRRSLVAVGDRGAVVVRYRALIDQPADAIQSLAEALGTTVPRDRLQAIRPELYRNREGACEVPLSASQSALWDWIERLPGSVDRIDLDDVPGGASERSIELVRSRRKSAALQSQVDVLRQALEESASALKQGSEVRSALELALQEARDLNEEILRSEQKLRESRDANAEALRAATIELAVFRDHVRHHESVRARQDAEIVRSSALLTRLAEERRLMDEHVEQLRVRRLEQTRRIEAMAQESHEAQVLLERLRGDLAAAHARELVRRHEREHLVRALSVVEGQRRAEEAAGRAVRASRAWRWGRKLAGPLRGPSTREEEA